MIQRNSHGFTLIEMSIVLVIIGLIIGAVLVGNDLIAAAAIRAQISQIEKYNTAVNTFRGKYNNHLPGDIPDPDASNFGFLARGQYAGEGDGNGLIESAEQDEPGGNSGIWSGSTGEVATFWVDLSTAGLNDGSFNTAQPTLFICNGSTLSIDLYLPQTKISGGHVMVWSGGWQEYPEQFSGGMGSGTGSGANYFAIVDVTQLGACTYSWGQPFLTVAQAYAIDTKMDDGLPQSGTVMAISPIFNKIPPWAVAGSHKVLASLNYYGDYDSQTGGPITPATTSPKWSISSGATMQQTCYDNVVNGATLVTNPEHYSIETNNGAGVNCWLSFQFQ